MQRRQQKSIFTQINNEFVYLFKYYISILWCFLFYRSIKKPELPKKTLIELYVEEKQKKFMGDWANIKGVNENIDDFLYDNSILEKVLSNEQNTLEPKWNSRILYESTPVGNIVMHYNVFKQCFNYYADNKSMTYHILNATCMKYCYLFRCRDFFIDEYVLNTPSPLVNMNKIQPIRKGGKEYDVYGVIGNGKKMQTSTIGRKLDRAEKEQRETNRFVYMGKCNDFSPFKYVKKEPIPQVDIRISSFKEYKKMVDKTMTNKTMDIEESKEETKEINKLKILMSQFMEDDEDSDYIKTDDLDKSIDSIHSIDSIDNNYNIEHDIGYNDVKV